jgi:hypothetical protein
MKVLLIADPPAGDKAERQLRELGNVEVIYRRAPHAGQVMDIPHGTEWVMGMNVRGLGVPLRAAAKRAGAHFTAIPPSWSAAQQKLEEDGFFQTLEASRPLKATLADAARAKPHFPVPVAVKWPKEVDPDVAPPAPEAVKPVAVSTVVVEPAPKSDDKREPRKLAARVVEAATLLFTSDPDLPGTTGIERLRKDGFAFDSLAEADVYAIRRNVRVGMGLNPSGGRRKMPKRPAPVVSKGGDLAQVKAAVDLLVEAMKRDGVSKVCVDVTRDPPRTEIDVNVTTTKRVVL